MTSGNKIRKAKLIIYGYGKRIECELDEVNFGVYNDLLPTDFEEDLECFKRCKPKRSFELRGILNKVKFIKGREDSL